MDGEFHGGRVTAITVCVDYSHWLANGLPRWQRAGRVLVVTAKRDRDTQQLLEGRPGVLQHLTNVFWAHGADFNKGAAIAEAFDTLDPASLDWVLFFDADIVPPEDWVERVAAARPRPGLLHGARRFDNLGREIGDPGLAGFFHLAHASDPNMLVRPIVDTHWRHAGNYDSTFQDRWPKQSHVLIPDLRLVHLGDTGRNWCGLGHDSRVVELHKERKRRKGWRHETID